MLYVRGDQGYGVNDLVDQGDGTVLDRATGLTWQQDDDGVARSWKEALAACEGLELGGEGDWRLPNAKELQGVVDYSRSPDATGSAAIDPVFGTSSVTDGLGQTNWPYFWSSTTHLDGVELGVYAVYVAFGEALGFMELPPGSGDVQLMDVHGAGAQRSDPKSGDPAAFPVGHGPQGDVIAIFNHVRCVRGGATFENITPTSTLPESGGGRTTGPPDETTGGGETTGRGGPAECDTEADCQVAGACPPQASMGCTCMPTPQGPTLCVPLCQTDADCPAPPGRTLGCSADGICVPG